MSGACAYLFSFFFTHSAFKHDFKLLELVPNPIVFVYTMKFVQFNWEREKEREKKREKERERERERELRIMSPCVINHCN